jgi:DNA-binding transcriptional regulator YdaS (Cro superfamily)
MKEKLIAYFGSQLEIAEALGVSESAVSQWMAEGELPPRRAMQVEAMTGGKITAFELVRGVVKSND